MYIRTITFLAISSVSFLACGGSDDEGGSSASGSYGAISDGIQNPTGTVDETTAGAVGEEYGKIAASSGAGAALAKASTAMQTVSCTMGGNFTVEASGTQSSGESTLSYNDCCYVADCCMNGGGHWYYSTDTSAAFSYCGSYDIDYACTGVTSSLEYSGCFSATGEWTYLVEVGGETFAVNGTYYDGSGSLEIHGGNGMWTCTYSGGSGSCTGSSGTFEF